MCISNYISSYIHTYIYIYISTNIHPHKNIYLSIYIYRFIYRVIIAGNSVVEAGSLSRDKSVNLKQQAAAAVPLKQFDTLLCQLLLNCPVELIPGQTDPCSINYPQQVR